MMSKTKDKKDCFLCYFLNFGVLALGENMDSSLIEEVCKNGNKTERLRDLKLILLFWFHFQLRDLF